MDIFILILISILILILLIYFTVLSKEPFINSNTNTNTNENYVLLGDSILKNDSYVSSGESVDDRLFEHTNHVYNFATDNAKIGDIEAQLSKVPIKLNTSNTRIFLSVGANNLLSYYVEENQDIGDTHVLTTLFHAYRHCVNSIRRRFSNAYLYVLDVYYPPHLQYRPFHSILREWNRRLYSISGIEVLDISNRLAEPDDFTFQIEPSSKGGEKIATMILGR